MLISKEKKLREYLAGESLNRLIQNAIYACKFISEIDTVFFFYTFLFWFYVDGKIPCEKCIPDLFVGLSKIRN